jgi:hypothetical protein
VKGGREGGGREGGRACVCVSYTHPRIPRACAVYASENFYAGKRCRAAAAAGLWEGPVGLLWGCSGVGRSCGSCKSYPEGRRGLAGLAGLAPRPACEARKSYPGGLRREGGSKRARRGGERGSVPHGARSRPAPRLRGLQVLPRGLEEGVLREKDERGRETDGREERQREERQRDF